MTLQQSISGYVVKDYKQTVLISSSMNCYAQLNLFPCQLMFFYFFKHKSDNKQSPPNSLSKWRGQVLNCYMGHEGGGRDESKEIEVRSRSCPCFPLAER